MAITKHEKKIGANTYSVEKFGAVQGGLVLVRLLRFLGPAFSEALGAQGADIETRLAKALRAFAETANEADFASLCEAFAAKTKVKQTAQFASGDRDIDIDLARVFDDHFASNYVEMFGWLTFAIQTNYADFLDVDRLSGLFRAAQTP